MQDGDVYISNRDMRREAGGKCRTTLWRWQNNDPDFPPIYMIGGQRHCLKSEWRAYLASKVLERPEQKPRRHSLLMEAAA
jgi:hypothetical protein